jgi:DNA-directed RNA polymerase specialized sigma24 family protein
LNAAVRIVESEYEDAKAEVIRTVVAKLANAGVELPDLDLEGFYNAAWQVLFLKLREGEEIENRKGFLVTVTYRLALSEYRGTHREHPLDLPALDQIAVETDHDAQIHTAKQLSELKAALRLKLSERELQAATLCYFQGYSRPEAAKVLGVTPRRMEKIMDRVSRKVKELAGTIRADRWCDEVDSLIRAYAAGILASDSPRYELARQHLDECSACRRKVLLLRGLLVVGPPFPLAALLAGSLAGAGGGAAAGSGGTSSAASGGGGAASGGSTAGSSTGLIVGGIAAGAAVVAAIAIGVLGLGSKQAPERQSTVGAKPAVPGVAAATTGAKKAAGGKANKSSAKPKEKRRRQVKPRRDSSPSPATPVEAQSANTPDPVATPEPAAAAPTPAPAPEQPAQPAPAPAPPPSEAPSQESAPSPKRSAPLRDAAVEFELR